MAHSGAHSLRLSAPGAGGFVAVAAHFGIGDAAPVFADVWLRPVARSVDPQFEYAATISFAGAELHFIQALNVGVFHVRDAAAPAEWRPAGPAFELEDENDRAKDWIRLTIRRDAATGIWDLWLNSRLAASGLGLVSGHDGGDFRFSNPPGNPAAGDLPAATYLDDLDILPSNPLYEDSDRDGLPNAWELTYGLDPGLASDRESDADADSASAIIEYQHGSKPTAHTDSDGDGMPDGWEIAHGFNPADPRDALLDPDGDGFSNLAEWNAGTDPRVPATGGSSALIYVRAGAGYPMNGSFSQPFATLESALSFVSTGGTVVVRGDGGPLTGLGNRNLYFSKGFTLRGTGNARINLESAGNLGTVWNYSYSPQILEDLSIENGYATDGGALYIGMSPGGILRRCRFLNSSASDDGGALFCAGGGLLLESCYFGYNAATDKGGAFRFKGWGYDTVTVLRSVFEFNMSSGDGAAIAAKGDSLIAHSCVFDRNSSYAEGGAVALKDGADGTFLHRTGFGNYGYGGGGFVYASSTASAASVEGCILWQNAPNQIQGGTVTVNDTTLTGGWAGGTANNVSNPSFYSGTLVPRATAMFDTGAPSAANVPDVNGIPRWDHPGFYGSTPADRGAYERGPDSDGDGMPDGWEIARGLNPNDPGDRDLDPDQDGLPNRSEYIFGKDPHDPYSSNSITYWVNPNPALGIDYAPGAVVSGGQPGDFTHPFRSIRRALLACPTGGRIALRDGTYAGERNVNLHAAESWTWTADLTQTQHTSQITLNGCSIVGINGPERVIMEGAHATRLLDADVTGGVSISFHGVGFRHGRAFAGESGGAIRITADPYGSSPGYLYLSNCVVSASEASNLGGGVHIEAAGGYLYVCRIVGNRAISGGGVSIVNAVDTSGYPGYIMVSLYNSRIAYNEATGNGGGILSIGSAIQIQADNGTAIDFNIAGSAGANADGGGLYALNNEATYFYGPVFRDNLATDDGGGAFFQGGHLHAEGCTLQRNRAGLTGGGRKGGGLCLYGEELGGASENFVLHRALIRDNHSRTYGGGLHVQSAAPLVFNCAFIGNYAGQDGGGVSAKIAEGTQSRYTAPILEHCTIRENEAGGKGGGYYGETGTVGEILNGIVRDNRADQPATGDPNPNIDTPLRITGSNIQLLSMGGSGLFGSMAATVDLSLNPLAAPHPQLSGFAADGYHQVALPSSRSDQAFTSNPDIDTEFFSGTPVDRGCDQFRDTDADGLPDWFEWQALNYLPDDALTTFAHLDGTSNPDGDPWNLHDELFFGGQANAYDDKDSDEDGLLDIWERLQPGQLQPGGAFLFFDPFDYDTDNDGMSDGWEEQYRSPHISPLLWTDPEGDVDVDANENVVGDGLSNINEFFYKTNPNLPDTDGDGFDDAYEISQGADPNDPNDTPDPENPKPVWRISLGVGDRSTSDSEHYRLLFYKRTEDGRLLESNKLPFTFEAGGPGHYRPDSGVGEIFTLPVYEHGIFVTLWWIKSTRLAPDYDYTVVCERHEGDFFVYDADGLIDNVTGDESNKNKPTAKIWKNDHHKGVNQDDVRGLHRIALLPIRIVPDDGEEGEADDMIGVVGDMVASNKTEQPERHFVTPKATPASGGGLPQPFVNLKVEGIKEEWITTGHAEQILQWDAMVGEEVEGNPLKWRVPRDQAGKLIVRIIQEGSLEEAAKLNVWVVWANIAPGYPIVGQAAFIRGSDSQGNSAATYEVGSNSKWKFKFKIEPSLIFNENNDVPKLRGEKRADVDVPGAGKLGLYPDEFADTAFYKWDVSRRIQVTISNPNGLTFEGTPWPVSLRSSETPPELEYTPIIFPTDPAEGNDDPHTSDENSDPYLGDVGQSDLVHALEEVTSYDIPRTPVASNFNASNAFKLDDNSIFDEFVRLEISDGKRMTGRIWYKVSDYIAWRFSAKFEYVPNGTWIDHGSETKSNHSD